MTAAAVECIEGWCRDVTSWPHPLAVVGFLVLLVLVRRACR